MTDYIRDGQAIYDRSFAIIRAEADLRHIPADLEKLAVRVIHACGMVDVANDSCLLGRCRQSRAQCSSGRRADLCDARMVAEGITRSRLPADNRVIYTLGDPSVPELAKRSATPGSAAALDLWLPHIEGSIVAIGNAPTALFRLLRASRCRAPKPALIIGMPVGFVGAAESKDELAANSRGVPYVIVRGRRGGSAMTAAAVNALASERE
ncbi:precorrin-8X methylmutase [Brucella abortus]|nr:precorrin-8X methylmutase [Brucella abortus]